MKKIKYKDIIKNKRLTDFKETKEMVLEHTSKMKNNKKTKEGYK